MEDSVPDPDGVPLGLPLEDAVMLGEGVVEIEEVEDTEPQDEGVELKLPPSPPPPPPPPLFEETVGFPPLPLGIPEPEGVPVEVMEVLRQGVEVGQSEVLALPVPPPCIGGREGVMKAEREGDLVGENEVEGEKVATPLPLPPPPALPIPIGDPLGLIEVLGERVEDWVTLRVEEEVWQAEVESEGV